MDFLSLSIISLSSLSFLTAIVSAVTGMGGGVLLLSFMAMFLPYHLVVPIHGVVQFFSNSTRAYYLRKSVNWKYFFYFLIGTPVGLIISYKILSEIKDPKFYYLLLSLFITYTVFKPKKLPTIKLEGFGWSILGAFAGLLGPLLGATGPLLAIFYVRDDLPKEEIIATKAMQQLIVHLLKIPLFLSLDFDYTNHYILLIFMILSVTAGTFTGIKILSKVNDKLFKKIFKTVLFLTGLRLFYKFCELL